MHPEPIARSVVGPTLERRALARHTVLIVEDDLLLLVTAADVLREAGFVVIEAETADQAAAILERDSREVSVVFSDIETPGRLDGLSLAQVIDKAWPTIPVLLTSGGVTPGHPQLPPRAMFLPKPYDFLRITHLIGQLVAG